MRHWTLANGSEHRHWPLMTTQSLQSSDTRCMYTTVAPQRPGSSRQTLKPRQTHTCHETGLQRILTCEFSDTLCCGVVGLQERRREELLKGHAHERVPPQQLL